MMRRRDFIMLLAAARALGLDVLRQLIAAAAEVIK
jgi:hypothetical protein